MEHKLTEKLLKLVKVRPAIYDHDAIYHRHHDTIRKLWAEIAEEMGWEVEECRMKYRSLRVSYNRYIKEVRKKPEPGARKPWWQYAEAMSFLEKHTLKKSISSINKSETASTSISIKEEPESPDSYVQENSTSNYLKDDSNDSEVIRNKRSSEVVADSTLVYNQKKRLSQGVSDPMLPFVENAYEVEDDPMEHFFKSIKADVDTLDSRRKLKFKARVLQLINELIEEQELCILHT